MSEHFPPVAELLPHASPMILIKSVTAYTPSSISCTLCTRSAMLPKTAEGNISLAVGYEWMAQSIGAYVGLTARKAGRPVKIGFLLGTRHTEFFTRYFFHAQILHCEVKLIGHFDELGIFDCEIFEGETLLMKGQIKVYQPQDVEDFFNTRKVTV